MQKYKNKQAFSPSDLVTFLECNHASYLDQKPQSERMGKTELSTIDQLLQKKGLEHEVSYLQLLKNEGKIVVEIPKDRNLNDRAALTVDAMKSGADVIYQGVFCAAPWRGDADFLIKCNLPSGLGVFYWAH